MALQLKMWKYTHVLCLTVVPLPPGENPFAVKIKISIIEILRRKLRGD
jgi:hypothetical protein